MTTRTLLISVTTLLMLVTLTDQLADHTARAAEPGLVIASSVAAETDSSMTSDEADLRRVKNELRFEQRSELVATMTRDFRSALDGVEVITD